MTSIILPEPDKSVLRRRDAIVSDLKAMLRAEQVISDEVGRRAFETDALTAYRRLPLAVVLPTSTSEVSDVLRYCYENNIKVVARGAGTSLCGGALPAEDAIVVGVSKMNRILEIDYPNRIARVETGVTNLSISNAVSEEQFFYAPDPSSQLACTLAGNLAMNSGGAHCLKYGVTTNNVLGLKVVLMTGEILEIGGKALESEGYDLLALAVGSEGQFGIVTEATVRILRAAEAARPMMIGFESAAKAGLCVAHIIASGIIPVALEFMDKPAIECCEAFAKAGYPLDVEALLIIEVEGSEDEISERLAQISEIANELKPMTMVVSSGPEQSERIWRGRKSAFGAIGRRAEYYCMDGTIPLVHLPFALERIAEICASYDLKVANIFHAGDGNLHPLIMYDAAKPEEAQRAELAGAEILKLCVEVGGCLSGEHGVGIEKRDLMHTQFDEKDLTVQARIKSVFDPKWLLNPAKVFPLDSRGGLDAIPAPPTSPGKAA